MRVLGFSKKWDKLQKPEFTTFRFPRKDTDKGRDWKVGEQVQVVYHPRNKDREYLFNAEIISKQPKHITEIDDAEAAEDGFANYSEMYDWLTKAHHGVALTSIPKINKLTLKRLEAK